MTTTTIEIDEAKRDAFQMSVLEELAGSYGGVMISIGNRLGLYEALDGAGPIDAAELAARTGCAERYVLEWLNGQAAAGNVIYDREAATYELPAEHAAVLADPHSPHLMTPAFECAAALWADADMAVEAFRSGAGVPWGEHDERLFCGVAAFYRNGYQLMLVPEWLPALDGVVERLEAGAKVADVGCGHGHSTVLMAQAFPESRFWGFDTHAESIAEARANAERAGVADRVTFEVATADGYVESGFDLVCFFDAFHDMGDPVGAAHHARRALAPEGSLMLVEPNAADDVADNVGTIAKLYYGGSTMLCTAHALSEDGGYALGAQAGPARLAEVLEEAGFRSFRKAAETPFNLIAQARVA